MSSLEELVKARDLTERAANYVELCGFDINVYSLKDEDGVTGETSNDRLAQYHGQGCYIGTYRIVAGVKPNPGDMDGSVDDGPELRIALEAADAVAREAISSRGLEAKVRARWEENEESSQWACADELGQGVPPGRLVETLGFIDERIAIDTDGDEQEDALRLLREVLTRLNNEIAEKEASQEAVPA